jgi:F-type H+-transporting ATPase subunit gamma
LARCAFTQADGNAGLVACFRDDDGARMQRLLPFTEVYGDAESVPLTNEPPARVASGV